MATCAEKKEAWQERVITIEENVVLPLIVPDVLYSCEGAIFYAPLNPLGYYLPEVARGGVKASGTGTPSTRFFSYLEITDLEYGACELSLFGRRHEFVYEIDADVRIGPLGPYNIGIVPRFTLFPSANVELVIEEGANAEPADVDEAPPMVAL